MNGWMNQAKVSSRQGIQCFEAGITQSHRLKADDAEPKPALDKKTDAQSSEGITQSWESAQEIKAEGNAHFKAGCPAEVLQVFSLLHSALTLLTVFSLSSQFSHSLHSAPPPHRSSSDLRQIRLTHRLKSHMSLRNGKSARTTVTRGAQMAVVTGCSNRKQLPAPSYM